MKIVAFPLQPSSSLFYFLPAKFPFCCSQFTFCVAVFLPLSLSLLFHSTKVSNTRKSGFCDGVDIRFKLAVFIGLELHFSSVKILQFCFTFVTHTHIYLQHVVTIDFCWAAGRREEKTTSNVDAFLSPCVSRVWGFPCWHYQCSIE